MKCPTCRKPVAARKENPHSPFCSERCKWVDLGKWLDEKYVIGDSSPSRINPANDDNE